MRKGMKLLEEVCGEGIPIRRGCRVRFSLRLWLNKGTEVPITRIHDVTYSRGGLVNGLFYAMEGMREGGFRKVRIPPHFMYRDEGFGELVPPNAVLIAAIALEEVWLPCE